MVESCPESSQPLSHVDQCDAAWLTEALRRSAALSEGVVEAVSRTVSSSTTATLAGLDVQYSGDACGLLPRRLFLKVGDRRKIPNLPIDFVLGDVRFYYRTRDVVGWLPTAACYDAALDEYAARFHVLLEDLSTTHQVAETGDRADPQSCSAMLECLADFHAFWWNHADLGRFGGPPDQDEAARYVQSVQHTLAGFIDAVADQVPTEVRQWYERFARDFGSAYASIFRPQDMTVIHGDVHPHNILLPRQAGRSARIVDWQFHHVSVCTQDIRHTLGLDWTTEARRAVECDAVKAYHRRLLARGVTGYSWDDCWHGYRVGAIDNLFMPMWQWTLGMPPRAWLPNIARAVAATKDLACGELL